MGFEERLYWDFGDSVDYSLIREEIERKRLERVRQLPLDTTDKIAHSARSH
jgi:hypothetical protein